MLNLETKAIIHSRDIIWLHKMHKDWVKDKSIIIASNEDDPIELPIGMRTKRGKDIETNVEITPDERNDTNVKVFREMKKLESWFNPQAKRAVIDFKKEERFLLIKLTLLSSLQLHSTNLQHLMKLGTAKINSTARFG
jgi:hypothetical protein